jgi:hypothetical protein
MQQEAFQFRSSRTPRLSSPARRALSAIAVLSAFADETTTDVRARLSQFSASLTIEFDVGDHAKVMNYPVQYSRHQINAGKHGH